MPAKLRSKKPEVLILAPLGRDARSIERLLVERGHAVHVCVDVNDLTDRIGPLVGVVVLTEEALLRGTPNDLYGKLTHQPPWSDLPFVYLRAPSRSLARPIAPEATLPRGLNNGMVLERPLGTQSLVSAIEWGLASRRRQYQIRDQIEQLHAQANQISEAAARVSESEARFRAITESMPQIVWSARPDGFHDYFNGRFLDFTGVDISQPSPAPPPAIVHPEDRAKARSAWKHALQTGAHYQVEYRMRHRDRGYRWHLVQAVAMKEDDRVVRWYGTCTDVDDQVKAREALTRFNEILEYEVNERTVALHQEMAERERAEAALRQSQKLEVIGQLTGGIAHDFNNFLTGVIGSLDIVKRRINAGRMEDMLRFMEVASSSAQRAATLTHRLLAFSRQQTLEPRPFDCNRLVESMHELVARSVDERITVVRRLAANLPQVLADEHQVESALLNLVINARDAMPNGGDLTIGTALVKVVETSDQSNQVEGQYVELTVADTGVGMSKDVLARATEPFFTTKPIGKGTGLGLSTIYGFARQSRGHLLIESTEGHGTTMRLRLPVADQARAQGTDDRAKPLVVGVGERILVVEDDPAVRALVVEVLRELLYEPVEAEEARAALEILRSAQRIDLMISDVGLPGMNGRQLADIARTHRPQLRVLFLTGYAGTESARMSELDAGMEVMTKPFEMNVLASRVRRLMQ